MNSKILLVDDERNVLDGFRRQLGNEFAIDLAESGPSALKMVQENGPYAIVVSDMLMEIVNGAELLAQVREIHPETVRMMLTGSVEQQTAIDAVNEGQIFRFLSKPCSTEQLIAALDAGLEQHRLVTAEKDLLTETLSGSISLLTDMMSVLSPTAFGRAGRVRQMVMQLCAELELRETWEIETAAMLAQIGCVTIPDDTISRHFQRLELSPEERAMVDSHAATGHDFVAKIPRLESVAKIILHQDDRLDQAQHEVPMGSRLLKAVHDFDDIAEQKTRREAYADLMDRSGWYDTSILDAMSALLADELPMKTLTINELEPGMILAAHVITNLGDRLVAKGSELNTSLIAKLHNFASTPRGVEEPIQVFCPKQV